jgi:hypothetical protein
MSRYCVVHYDENGQMQIQNVEAASQAEAERKVKPTPTQVLLGEVVQGRFIEDKNSAKPKCVATPSLSTHTSRVTRRNTLLSIFSSKPAPSGFKKYPTPKEEPKHNGQYTDPECYSCDS